MAEDDSFARLISECSIDADGCFLRPHPRRSVWSVASLLLDMLHGCERGVVMIALDGVGWLQAQALEPDDLRPLTTTFPSTSVVRYGSKYENS